MDFRSYEKLGAHVGAGGVAFAVQAPGARHASVIGEFNAWDPGAHPMRPADGAWEAFVPNVANGALYKYVVDGAEIPDPFAFDCEPGGLGASRVCDLSAYGWRDAEWLGERSGRNSLTAPITVYRVHLASWRRVPEEGDRPLTYRELAPLLADYAYDLGFTHVELVSAAEPRFPYAPRSRMGTPYDLMFLLDALHQRKIGVTFHLETGDPTFWVEHYHADADMFPELAANREFRQRVLAYFSLDPIHRAGSHYLVAAAPEPGSFLLSLPEASLISRMPGDYWQRFANLRALYGYLLGYPGKKRFFMGSEFGQWSEWNPDGSLDWHLLDAPMHRGLQRYVRDLNTIYRAEPSLHEADAGAGGFEWIDTTDSVRSVLAFVRSGRHRPDPFIFICNFTPVPRHNYRIGVPHGGHWREVLNSDAPLYGGSGQGNVGAVAASPVPMHGRPYSLSLTLPPLAVLVFRSAS
jgi:1,4-alpha-glucan branching enzyme